MHKLLVIVSFYCNTTNLRSNRSLTKKKFNLEKCLKIFNQNLIKFNIDLLELIFMQFLATPNKTGKNFFFIQIARSLDV